MLLLAACSIDRIKYHFFHVEEPRQVFNYLFPPKGLQLSLREIKTFKKKDLFDFSTGEKKNVHTILPSDLEFFPDHSGESLLVSSTGTIVWLDNEMSIKGQFQVESANTLKNFLETKKTWDNEGVMGLAFDPNFQKNRYFYVQLNLKPKQGLYVWRLIWLPDQLEKIWESRKLVFSTDKLQIATRPAYLHNHNGGNPSFGPDGKLYLFIGDGGIGGANYHNNVAQRSESYWGKIIRLNPHSDDSPEMIAKGVRNPFSHSWFGNSVIIGDAGPNQATDWEEINFLNMDHFQATVPVNFAWPFFSGHCPPDNLLGCKNFIDPIHGYGKIDSTFIAEDPKGEPPPKGTKNRSAVIVGPVYSGKQYNGYLANVLIYTDLVQGWIRGAFLSDDGKILKDRHLLHHSPKFVTSIKKGPDDFLYLTSGYGRSVSIFRIEGPTLSDETAAKEESGPLVLYPTSPLPQKLSTTLLFQDLNSLTPASRAWEYKPAYPIWKNGAQSKRFLILPPNAKIDTSNLENWTFPEGSLLVKHLTLETIKNNKTIRQNIETQVLQKTGAGWQAGAYKWNEEGEDAELTSSGSVIKKIILNKDTNKQIDDTISNR